MRIAIREQLALLVVLLVLISLCIVAIPVWVFIHNFVIDVESDGLTLTASLKASSLSADLELIQTECYTISSRILVQNAFQDFYRTGVSNWSTAHDDVNSALSVGATTGLLQARLYSRNTTGADQGGLLNVTAANAPDVILPYASPDGGQVKLGDPGFGYPPELFPNITYLNLGHENTIRNNTAAFSALAFPGVRITLDGGLLLGPVVINSTAALLSVSIPIRDNTDDFILGYMTVVSLSRALVDLRDSREGLGDSGMILLVGPNTPYNRFSASHPSSNSTYRPDEDAFEKVRVKFVLPPKTPDGQNSRHGLHSYRKGTSQIAFPVKKYPAAFDSFTQQVPTPSNSSTLMKTHNEQGVAVSVGFARTQTSLVDWTVLIEKSRSEAFKPINTLKQIILGTTFGTIGLIFLIILPIAHLSVLPIRRLKSATENSINPPGYEDYSSSMDGTPDEDNSGSGQSPRSSKLGFFSSIIPLSRRKPRPLQEDSQRRMFKIPAKVEDRRHFIRDELTELTTTFNDMSDELLKQYVSLDDKVAERTRELNASKKAAEAANESKTLFIANISHELKTPLNGILGMCAVCMEENDLAKVKQSLRTLYKSGDLLLHLLEDLLSFSKNQIGQQLQMEFKEFRLADIRSQILTIFEKQVREGAINFSVDFYSAGPEGDPPSLSLDSTHDVKLPALGPQGTGRLRDMCLWGDQHRILQVLINLVSNSLKFTPPGGNVHVRIRCLGEISTAMDDSSRHSSMSRNSKTSRKRTRGGSIPSSLGAASANARGSPKTFTGNGTALCINPVERGAAPYVQVRERSQSPPPPGTKTLAFEFEVQDTGPGIPEHMQQKVFEPFVQGDLGLSRKYGGTGLGLSICHQLAGLMGGSMDLRSTVDEGTTFIMHIPLKYMKERAASTTSSSVHSRPVSVVGDDTPERRSTPQSSNEKSNSPPVMNPQPRLVGLNKPFFAAKLPQKGNVDMSQIEKVITNTPPNAEGKLRVLVADDNSTNIEVVSRMLKLESVYNVTIAHDGQEAYEAVKATMAKNESFDVIFMDVQMPGVNGLQSTRLIRDMGYKSPIVALTAFAEESNMQECIASGMDEFLSKPIRRPALKQVLRKFAPILEEEAEAASSPTQEEKKKVMMMMGEEPPKDPPKTAKQQTDPSDDEEVFDEKRG